MTKRRKILMIGGGLIILIQIFFFKDYVFPIQWGQIEVIGLACTCPDEKVLIGEQYLESITPDSLKKYNLDFSEIYVDEKPSSPFDPMGVDKYLIKGRVVGKERVSKYDPWNPKVSIEKWRRLDSFADWGIKILLVIELSFLVLLLRYYK